jgi:hypothetical protein
MNNTDSLSDDQSYLIESQNVCIGIFFGSVIVIFSIIYCATKCFIIRKKRSRSVSDENIMINNA